MGLVFPAEVSRAARQRTQEWTELAKDSLGAQHTLQSSLERESLDGYAGIYPFFYTNVLFFLLSLALCLGKLAIQTVPTSAFLHLFSS